MFRIFLSTAIISLGLAGGFYFVTSYHLPIVPQSQPTALTLNNNPVSNQPLIEQLTPNRLDGSLINNSFTESLGMESELANEISGNLAQFLIENNPEEPNPADGQQFINVPNEQEILNQMLAKSLAKLNDLKPAINNSDLNIVGNPTEEELKSYASGIKNMVADHNTRLTAVFNQQQTNIANLYQKNSDQFLNNFTDANNEAAQKQLVELLMLNYKYFSIRVAMLNDLEKDLYETSVPQPALEIHKNLLSLVVATQKVLTEVQNLKERDPLANLLNQQVLQAIDFEFSGWIRQLPNLKINS